MTTTFTSQPHSTWSFNLSLSRSHELLIDTSFCYYSHHSRRSWGGGRPPIRFKTSKIRANGLFIWANSLDIWAHHCQNTVSVSVQTFFFFFFENTSIWAEKTVLILTEERNASSHFSGKS